MKSEIIVINLDKSRTRLARMHSQFRALGLNFLRLPGLQGSSLTAEEKQRHYCDRLNRRTFHLPMTPGEIGCYLSHRNAWQAILDLGLDYAVILEDDVILGDDFAHALEMVPDITESWDMIKLGAVSRKPVLQRTALGRLDLCRYLKVPISAYAQIVSRSGAEKLLPCRETFGRPVDVDLQYVWENSLDILGLEPFPVSIRPNQPSDIGPRPERTFFGAHSYFGMYREHLRFGCRMYYHNLQRYGMKQTLRALQSRRHQTAAA